jgi:hypothetical protein
MDSTPTRLTYALLGLLALYHATLLGRGALAFPDEFMSFRGAHQIAGALAHGDVRGAAAGTIGFWGARPAEFLMRAPAAGLQRVAGRWTGLPPSSPSMLVLATAQNVAVSLALSLVFLHLTRRLIADPTVAAVATGTFSLLATNHLWVRHLIPYDAALAAHLAALGMSLGIGPPEKSSWRRVGTWAARGVPAVLVTVCYPLVFYRYRFLGLPWAGLVLVCWAALAAGLGRGNGGLSRAVRTGLVSGCALALYPAYYSFVPALGLIVLLSASPDRLLSVGPGSALAGAAYGAGVLTVVFAFEVLARVGGLSYLGAASLMSRYVKEGTFDEGFVFLPRYLFATDGPAALFLLAAAALSLIVLVRAAARGTVPPRDVPGVRVVLVLGALYLAYGFQSTVLHLMNFSGRYARMYIPAVVWLAALGVVRLRPDLRRWAIGLWCVCAAAGFARFASGYAAVGFPADVLFEAGVRYEDLDAEHVWHESEIIPNYNLPVEPFTAGSAYVTRPGDDRFHIVNFGFFDLRGSPRPRFAPPAGYVLAVDRKHFLSFPPMPFEGFPESKRAELLGRGYRLQVWCRESDCPLAVRKGEQ